MHEDWDNPFGLHVEAKPQHRNAVRRDSLRFHQPGEDTQLSPSEQVATAYAGDRREPMRQIDCDVESLLGWVVRGNCPVSVGERPVPDLAKARSGAIVCVRAPASVGLRLRHGARAGAQNTTTRTALREVDGGAASRAETGRLALHQTYVVLNADVRALRIVPSRSHFRMPAGLAWWGGRRRERSPLTAERVLRDGNDL